MPHRKHHKKEGGEHKEHHKKHHRKHHKEEGEHKEHHKKHHRKGAVPKHLESWHAHVRAYRHAHPHESFKNALKGASKTYKK